MSQPPTSRGLGLFLVIVATAFWSTSGIFISLVIKGSGVSPAILAFWRDLGTFCSLFIGIFVFRRDLLRIKHRDLLWLAIMGAVSVGLFHVLWNTAVILNGASVSTIVQANAPVFVTVMAWLVWREPLTGRKIGAIALASLGTLLLSSLESLGNVVITPLGLTVALGAAITYGTFTLIGKKLSSDYSSWTILIYVFGFATLALLPFQVRSPLPWPISPGVLASYAALVLITTVAGFGLYTLGLRRLQASVASITANTEVPFAAILAYIVLGERLDIWQVAGGVLIIAAVVLISLPSNGRREGHDVSQAAILEQAR